MIRNEQEYQEAVRRLRDEKARLDDHRRRLAGTGLKPAEVKRAVDPLASFHAQLAEEIGSYERLRRGEFDEIENFRGIGRTLVALRIAAGVTQRELAVRLEVHESQVSRDERNEYHGITVERAARILDALGAHLTTRVDLPPRPRRSSPSAA